MATNTIAQCTGLLDNYLATEGACSYCHLLPKSSELLLLECFHSICEKCIIHCSNVELPHLLRCPISICRHATLLQNKKNYNLLVSDISFIKNIKTTCASNTWVCSSHSCTASSIVGQYFCLDCRHVLCREDGKLHRKLGKSSLRHSLLSKDEICSMSLEDLLKQMQNKFGCCPAHDSYIYQIYNVVNKEYGCEKCTTDQCVGHLISRTDEIVDNAKSALEEALKANQKLSSQSRRLIADLNTEFDRIMISRKNFTLQIDEFYTEAIKEIQVIRDSMLDSVNRKYDSDLEDLNASIQNVQYMSELNDRCFNYIDLAYNYNSGSNLHNSHQSLLETFNKFSTELSNCKVPNYGEVEFSIQQSISDFQQVIHNLAVLHLGSKYESGTIILRPTLETPQPLQYIYSLTSDKEGWIYVTDAHSHCVHIFSDETYVRKIGEQPNLNCPIGVAVSGNYIYISDWMNHKLICYNVSGKFVECTPDKDLWCPRGLTISEHSQEIYLADLGHNCIKTYGLNLEPKSSFQHAELDQPKDVLLSGNNLIVLDSSEFFLHIFDMKGMLLRHLVDSASQMLLKTPSFIAIDFEGNIIITDEEDSNIGIYYLPENRYIQHTVRTAGNVASEFTGVCVDCQGTLLVADNTSKRIMKCLIKTKDVFLI